MRYILRFIFVIFLFVSFTNAQELSRSQEIEQLRIVDSKVEQTARQIEMLTAQRNELLDNILSVNFEDKKEARRIGAEAVRIFPDGILNSTELDERDYSIHAFTDIARYYYAPRIEYKRNNLMIVRQENVVAFMANIGGTLLETVDARTKEAAALAKFEPPDNPKDAESEITIDGLSFGKYVPVVVGNTYILRGISYGSGDGIVAFKIQRKDSDGSLVLFIKKISDQMAVPKLPEENYPSATSTPAEPDYATQQAVQNALLQKGFYNVIVTATTEEIKLSGTVEKMENMAQAVRTAHDIGKRKVNNQITVKK